MDLREISIIYHIGVVLCLLCISSSFNYSHPTLYFASLFYIYQVHGRYHARLQKKLQFEERKAANQKRLLSDSETVQWLNHAVEKIWPICMEQIASQNILLPIIPWFLEKYKPWTAKEAVVQHLYMGRTPPMFTEMRVLNQSSSDDHLVLELGMNFRTADDMSAILAVKLRRRLGFGMWAKLHVTGMHIEGKVLVGVKFLREWPFLGRLRICFVEPPYFQMTVKPIVSHGLDVTEIPGIAGWLDKLLSVAFEQTLVEPNMLVVDMEKFASASTESWFTVDEKDPIAYLKVEIVEAADVKPSDPNGRADPYVKGQLGPYRFRTKIQKKTLTPKWLEEFKIPIFTWESQNILALKVCDKDHFVDDTLGDCFVNINDMKDGQRHDMWLSLQNIEVGRLHVSIIVLDINIEEEDYMNADCSSNKKDGTTNIASETAKDVSNSATPSKNAKKISDEFEPINVEGQQKTGIWVHHPGNDVSQTWEPRTQTRQTDIQNQKEENAALNSPPSIASGNSSSDENTEENKPKSLGSFRKSIKKIGSVFHRNPRSDDLGISEELSPTLNVNLQAVDETGSSVNITREDKSAEVVSDSNAGGSLSPENEIMSLRNDGKRGRAKSILKQVGYGVKHVLTRKGSRKSRDDATFGADNIQGSDSLESSQSSSVQHKPTFTDMSGHTAPTYVEGVKSRNPREQTVDVRTPGSTRLKTVSFETVAKTSGPGDKKL